MQIPLVHSPNSPLFFKLLLKEEKVCISGMQPPLLNLLVCLNFFLFFFSFAHVEFKVHILLHICPGKAAEQQTPLSSASAPFLRSPGSSCFMCFSF